MKKIKLITLLIASLVSNLCYADCMQGAKLANSFIDEYLKYVFHQQENQTIFQWLQKNKKLTDNFKKSYQQLVEKAEKEDPELGLDFDPIFNAQDFPEQGFNIVNCEEDSNFVTLAGKGKDWEGFKVVLKVVNTKKGWLVDGSGAVNIPENKQPNR